MTHSKCEKRPKLLDVYIPIIVLVACLAWIITLFRDDAGGYTPLALIVATAVTCLVAMKNGFSWNDMEEGMVATVASGLKAVLVLLTVGALVGGWILSGTVPAMIYWGVQLLSPQWFYPATALICAIAGLSIGSSWTVAGALGVGLMGIATVMGLSPAITAGAIISGAYLGDKLSPLSDTTNLAAGVTGNDLFRHIRHMGWTTIPAFAIALLVYSIVGGGSGEIGGDFAVVNKLLSENFYLGLPVLMPLLLVLGLAIMRKPVLPVLLMGIVAGVIVSLLFQRHQVAALAGGDSGSFAQLKGVAIALLDGFAIESGNDMLNKLLSKGGMSNMLSTVFLIICALSFGGAFERAGLLQRAVEGVLKGVKTVGGLISSTLATGIGTNLVCADQYIAIVMPSKMYQKTYREKGLHALNLSRAVEDSGTLTSVLIPWNTCGLYMAGVLGVTAWGWGDGMAAFAYAPWAILCWLCPIISAVYGYLSFRILPLAENTVPANAVVD